MKIKSVCATTNVDLDEFAFTSNELRNMKLSPDAKLMANTPPDDKRRVIGRVDSIWFDADNETLMVEGVIDSDEYKKLFEKNWQRLFGILTTVVELDGDNNVSAVHLTPTPLDPTLLKYEIEKIDE